MRVLLVLSCLVLASVTTVAQRPPSRVVYSQYFTSYNADSIAPYIHLGSGKASKRSGTKTTKSPHGFRLFGPFAGTETVTLSLKDLPPHRRIIVDVAFHIIGSWDGVLHQDALVIQAGQSTIFNETFSNTTQFQSYPRLEHDRSHPARTGARNRNMLGFRYKEKGVFDGVMDATYEHAITMNHSDSTLTLRIAAKLKDVRPSREKESWGLEHIVVRIEDGELPSDIFPARRQEVVVFDEQIATFAGQDVRSLPAYKHDEDLIGVVPNGPWDTMQHATLFRTKCMSCGDVCMMYTYIVYSDGWVNVWSNREPVGEALFSCTITAQERRTISELVSQCLRTEIGSEYHAADLEDHPDIEHCELQLRHSGKEHRLKIEGGEPESITKLMATTLAILRSYGWYPSPFISN